MHVKGWPRVGLGKCYVLAAVRPLTGTQEGREAGGGQVLRDEGNQMTVGQSPASLPTRGVASHSVLLADGPELRVTFCSSRVLLADFLSISFYSIHSNPDF